MYIVMFMHMTQDVLLAPPTIRLKGGVNDRLKEAFELPTDTAVAEHIGIDQGQYSRVLAGRSNPGPQFQARLLIAAEPLQLGFYDLFTIVRAA